VGRTGAAAILAETGAGAGAGVGAGVGVTVGFSGDPLANAGEGAWRRIKTRASAASELDG
jgi:hypothetical protein